MPFLRAPHGIWLSLFRIFLLPALLISFEVGQAFAQPRAADAPSSVPVYVSDFEMFSATENPSSGTAPSATPEKRNSESRVVYDDADMPSLQARRLMDFFSATLLQALQKKGFQATRVTSQNPSSGALVRGVFAEPDARNRIRRALLGGASPRPRFFLYVGIFNLARPDQPLYQLAPVQSPSNQFGPIITLNAYIPLAKYELDKNPSEEEVRKICDQIVASLVSLLAGNAEAFSK